MPCSRGALSALWLSSVIISKHFLLLVSISKCDSMSNENTLFQTLTLTFEFYPDTLWKMNEHVDGTCASVPVTYMVELMMRAWLCPGAAAVNLPEDTQGFWRVLSFGQRELCHHRTRQQRPKHQSAQHFTLSVEPFTAFQAIHCFHTFADTGCPRVASLQL